MANLVHIKEISFYYVTLDGHTDSKECQDALKLIDDLGINVNELLYNYEPHHSVVFESLSTWGWGPKLRQKKLDIKFPFLHWIECYDDFTQHHEHAIGLDEIKNSAPVKNPSLCAKKE